MKLQLHILTPEKEILKQEADEVTIPTTAGVIGVLPEHAPLVSQIAPGEIEVRHEGKLTPLAVYGGFADIADNNVTILADYAARVEDMELAKIEEAKQRAEKLMSEKLSNEDYINAQAELNKAIMQLRVLRKHRSHN